MSSLGRQSEKQLFVVTFYKYSSLITTVIKSELFKYHYLLGWVDRVSFQIQFLRGGKDVNK